MYASQSIYGRQYSKGLYGLAAYHVESSDLVTPSFGDDTDPCTAATQSGHPNWSPNFLTCLDPTLSPAMAACCKANGQSGPAVISQAASWVAGQVTSHLPGAGGSSSSSRAPAPSGSSGRSGLQKGSSMASNLLPIVMLGGAVLSIFRKGK